MPAPHTVSIAVAGGRSHRSMQRAETVPCDAVSNVSPMTPRRAGRRAGRASAETRRASSPRRSFGRLAPPVSRLRRAATATVFGGDLQRRGQPRLHRMVRRFEREHQQRAVRRRRRDDASAGVEHPAVRRVEAGLRDRPGGRGPGPKSSNAPTSAGNRRRSCSRIHASVMTPRVPSEPRNIRSGRRARRPTRAAVATRHTPSG